MTDRHTERHTDRQTDASDLIICPMLCNSNGTDNDVAVNTGLALPRSLWCCVHLLFVCNVCIVAKRCVLEQKILLTVYIGSCIQGIDWYQTQRPWHVFGGRLRSWQASHSPLNISETVRGLVPKDYPIGKCLWWVEWPCDRWRHVTSKRQIVTPIRLESPISRKQLEMLF